MKNTLPFALKLILMTFFSKKEKTILFGLFFLLLLSGGFSASAQSFSTGMGKGLSEPCSPYRTAYVFGAELNAVYFSSNCPPSIMDPTTSFDLSSITPNHEVVVALLDGYYLPSGSSYLVQFKWYRARDAALLYTFSYTIPDPGSYGYGYWSWYYVYSYIGYVSWEIWENGGYYVDITVTGGTYYSTRTNFTISGVAPPDTTPPTGILSASPTTVTSGQAITVTVTGYDNVDVGSLYAWYGSAWHSYTCSGIQTSCTYSWYTSESAPGSYGYCGYVFDSGGNAAWTNPSCVTITVVGPPTVVTDSASNIAGTSASLNGHISSDGGTACSVRFVWGDTASYGSASGWTGYSYYSGNYFTLGVSSLTKGKTYHFQAQAQHSGDATVYAGSDAVFTTKPDAPSSFTATAVSSSQINLSWSKGSGAYYTIVRRSTTGYPISTSDGIQVYYDTGTSYSDIGLTTGTTYYYSAWSQAYEEGYTQYSDTYATASAIPSPTCGEACSSLGYGYYAQGTSCGAAGYPQCVSNQYCYYNCNDSIQYARDYGNDCLCLARKDCNCGPLGGATCTSSGCQCGQTCSSVGAYAYNYCCATCGSLCGWRSNKYLIPACIYSSDKICILGTDCFFSNPYVDSAPTSCSGSGVQCKLDMCPDYSGQNGDNCTVRRACTDWWYGAYGSKNTGKWDAAEKKCVQCDANHKETGYCASYNSFNMDCNYDQRESAPCAGTGNGLCESACGASVECDEKAVGDGCAADKKCDNNCQCSVYDTTPPTTSILIKRASTGLPPAEPWLKAEDYIIQFTDKDNVGGSGLKSCRYYINRCNADGTNCTTSVVPDISRTCDQPLPAITLGISPYNYEGRRYLIYSYATDNVNLSGSASVILWTDFTPPSTNIR